MEGVFREMRAGLIGRPRLAPPLISEPIPLQPKNIEAVTAQTVTRDDWEGSAFCGGGE